jgi:hypothetical protein
VRLDHLQQTDNNSRIKGLVKPRGAEEVPRVDDQVNETEPQEGIGGYVAVRAGNGLPGRRRGERLSLAPCRLNHSSDWVIPVLITYEHRPSLIALNASQQQRSEAVPNHNVLDQLAYRKVRWRRPIP